MKLIFLFSVICLLLKLAQGLQCLRCNTIEINFDDKKKCQSASYEFLEDCSAKDETGKVLNMTTMACTTSYYVFRQRGMVQKRSIIISRGCSAVSKLYPKYILDECIINKQDATYHCSCTTDGCNNHSLGLDNLEALAAEENPKKGNSANSLSGLQKDKPLIVSWGLGITAVFSTSLFM